MFLGTTVSSTRTPTGNPICVLFHYADCNMGVHPFKNILIPMPSRVKQDSCEIFLYSGIKIGTVFQPQKQAHFFVFLQENLKS